MSSLLRFFPIRFRAPKREILLAIDAGPHLLRFVAAEKFDHTAIAFAKRQYILSQRDENRENTASDRIISKIRETIFHTAKKYGKIPERAVIGFSGHFAFNTVIAHKEEFDKKQAITATIVSRATEEVTAKQKNFAQNINGVQCEFALMRASPIRISIDGYDASAIMPPAIPGTTMELTLLLTYVEKNFLAGCKNIQEILGGIPMTFANTHIVVIEAIMRKNAPRDFLLVKIGGDAIEASLIRNGTLWWTEMILSGGNSITQAIAANLAVSRSRAEEIKRQYGRLQLPANIKERARVTIENENKRLIEEIRALFLKKQSLLPPHIFVYGGGAETPLLMDMFRAVGWREDISFAETADIQLLNAADIAAPALQSNFLQGPEDMGLASLAVSLI